MGSVVAGASQMSSARFLAYNLAGAVLWVAGLTYAGYFFGNLTWVRDNLTLIIIALIIIPGLPALLEFVRVQYRR